MDLQQYGLNSCVAHLTEALDGVLQDVEPSQLQALRDTESWTCNAVCCSLCCPVSPTLQMRVVPRLSYAQALEARQHSLLPSWQWPTWLMFWTWLAVHIYSFIRYNYYGGAAWQSVILWILNKSVGE